MFQISPQLTLSQKFTLHAQCSKGFRVKRICISPICHYTNIYLCGKFQDECECHYQHKNCPTISNGAFCQKFENYRKDLKAEVQDYIQRYEKVFNNLENKIKKQAKLFKNHYQTLLFGDIKSSIQRKIQNKDFNSLTSFEVSNFLKCLQFAHKEINCGKLTITEAHQLDKKMTELFSFIENLYQKKIMHQKIKPMRSYSSSCFEKDCSQQKFKDQFRKSSIFQTSKESFSQKLSTIIEKKRMNGYFQEKITCLKPPKINLDYPKAIQSKIIESVSMINNFIGKRIHSYEMLFRASENSFLVKNFYHRIQDLNNLNFSNQNISGYLFIIKTEFNHIFGAFTEISLREIISKRILQKNQSKNESESESQLNPEELKTKRNKFCSDVKSLTFLFSLNLKQKYHLKHPQRALYIGSNTLGFGNSDIRIRSKSHLFRESSCRIGDSYTLGQSPKHFNIDYDKRCRQITGSRYGKKFKIDEWECFKVTYSKNHQKE